MTPQRSNFLTKLLYEVSLKRKENPMLQKIEIDWDIHKLIENERRGFDEPPHFALRRLLGLHQPDAIDDKHTIPINNGGLPWTDEGVIIPHNSEARMEYDYGRQVYEGIFADGKLIVGSNRFDTLSKAARSLARTKAGDTTELNGWKYWKARFPGESEWRSLWDMREAARRKS
jgi:hypothetical protein